MAVEEIMTGVNDLTLDLGNVISNIPGIDMLVKIGQIAGIVVIVYVVFLIIRGLMQWKYTRRVKSIAKNVDEINQKLDLLIGKKQKPKKVYILPDFYLID